MSKKKIILIVICVVLLLILVPIIVLGINLLIKYNNTSYEYIPPVERESEYVMPDYPEIIIDTDGVWQEGIDLTEETESSTESMEETEEPEEITTETSAPETETTPPETSAPETETYKPAETIAPVVNANTNTTYTPPSNPNASFSNSSNAVSVYGSVPIYKVDQKDPDIKNILVMGTDTRDVTSDRGRSDSMIVVSYNSKTGSVKLTSLLRDSLVPIEGHDWNRINTAYFYGGVGLAINTVNQLFNLDIQEFVVVDFNGVKDFINYVGGVDITLTAEEAELYSTEYKKEIPAGLYHMDGAFALRHMRNRTIGTDFGRTQRQRDVIVAMMNQIMNQKSATEIYDIFNYSFNLIKTNISATDLVSLGASVLTNSSQLNIETQNVPYTDAYQFGWYGKMAILYFDIADAAARINDFIYGK